MSVVVTWTSRGRGRPLRASLTDTSSRLDVPVAPAVGRPPQRVLEAHAARDLALEVLPAVAALDRRTREPVHVGLPGGVRTRARERGRTEPRAYLRVGGFRRRNRLRVREVRARAAEAVLDQPARAVELVGDATRGQAVEHR